MPTDADKMFKRLVAAIERRLKIAVHSSNPASTSPLALSRKEGAAATTAASRSATCEMESTAGLLKVHCDSSSANSAAKPPSPHPQNSGVHLTAPASQTADGTASSMGGERSPLILRSRTIVRASDTDVDEAVIALTESLLAAVDFEKSRPSEVSEIAVTLALSVSEAASLIAHAHLVNAMTGRALKLSPEAGEEKRDGGGSGDDAARKPVGAATSPPGTTPTSATRRSPPDAASLQASESSAALMFLDTADAATIDGGGLCDPPYRLKWLRARLRAETYQTLKQHALAESCWESAIKPLLLTALGSANHAIAAAVGAQPSVPSAWIVQQHGEALYNFSLSQRREHRWYDAFLSLDELKVLSANVVSSSVYRHHGSTSSHPSPFDTADAAVSPFSAASPSAGSLDDHRWSVVLERALLDEKFLNVLLKCRTANRLESVLVALEANASHGGVTPHLAAPQSGAPQSPLVPIASATPSTDRASLHRALVSSAQAFTTHTLMYIAAHKLLKYTRKASFFVSLLGRLASPTASSSVLANAMNSGAQLHHSCIREAADEVSIALFGRHYSSDLLEHCKSLSGCRRAAAAAISLFEHSPLEAPGVQEWIDFWQRVSEDSPTADRCLALLAPGDGEDDRDPLIMTPALLQVLAVAYDRDDPVIVDYPLESAHCEHDFLDQSIVPKKKQPVAPIGAAASSGGGAESLHHLDENSGGPPPDVGDQMRQLSLGAFNMFADYAPSIHGLGSATELLDESARQQLHAALPPHVQGFPWSVVFSTFHHGTSFNTMYRLTKEAACPVVVAVHTEADGGTVVGAYLPQGITLNERATGHIGEGFVFTVSRVAGSTTTCRCGAVRIFRDADRNKYVCVAKPTRLQIGGGQTGPALFLNEYFATGATYSCETFSSPPLITSTDHGSFDITRADIYGVGK